MALLRIEKLTLFDELFRFYGFKELIDVMVKNIGFGPLIALLGAYFAAIVYFSAISSKGRFSVDFSQGNAVEFFSAAFYFFSFPIFLMPFISGWYYFVAVLFLYLIIAIGMLVNVRVLSRDVTFDEYVQFRQSTVTFAAAATLLKLLLRRYIGISLIWILVFGELLAFSYFDTTLPLYGWLIIFYSLIVALLQVAVGQGFLYNVRTCAYAQLTTTDGLVEGFIVAKGSDHYLVKTKEKEVLLSSEYVKSVSPLAVPKADKKL